MKSLSKKKIQMLSPQLSVSSQSKLLLTKSSTRQCRNSRIEDRTQCHPRSRHLPTSSSGRR